MREDSFRVKVARDRTVALWDGRLGLEALPLPGASPARNQLEPTELSLGFGFDEGPCWSCSASAASATSDLVLLASVPLIHPAICCYR